MIIVCEVGDDNSLFFISKKNSLNTSNNNINNQSPINMVNNNNNAKAKCTCTKTGCKKIY